MNPKSDAKRIVLQYGPRVVSEATWVRARSKNVVFRAVDTLVSRGDVALDIGAAHGVFSARLLPLVGRSGRVCAFEPNPIWAEELRSFGGRGLEVYPFGLSDRTGVATLRVPVRGGDQRGGMGSLEGPKSKQNQTVVEVEVQVKRLDDLLTDLPRLDFVKCDVEGHEGAVLEGALSLLDRHHPSVLIEIEQRHQDGPVEETFSVFRRLGYSGWAFFPGGLRPIANFDLQRDQVDILRDNPLAETPPETYVHNFLFVARDIRIDSLLDPDLARKSNGTLRPADYGAHAGTAGMSRIRWAAAQWQIRSRQLREYARNDDVERLAQRRGWFFDVARRFTPVVAVDSELGRLFVSTNDRVIGAQTFMVGGFDQDATARVLAELEHHVPSWQTGDPIVDIGANIGITSLILSRYGPVIAFEPAPANLALLLQNVIANGLQDTITVRGVALSDTGGTLTLELSGENSGDHRIRVTEAGDGGEDFLHEATRATVDVEAVRLDDELSGRPVSLVWMDAQGHEAQILSGAPHLLASTAPMVIEYWPYGLRRAGGLELLEHLVGENFVTVVDASRHDSEVRVFAAGDLHKLRDRYDGPGGYTDLILLK